MTFQEAVQITTNLGDKWSPGLQALRTRDREHIEAEDTRRLTGSLDLDTAMRSTDPNANRWDFAIGYRHTKPKEEWIYWVEIHSASDGEIGVVLYKFDWLKRWLEKSGTPLRDLRLDFVWVSSGATTFTRTSPQLRRFAQKGLRYAGKMLRIQNERS